MIVLQLESNIPIKYLHYKEKKSMALNHPVACFFFKTGLQAHPEFLKRKIKKQLQHTPKTRVFD